VGQRLPQLRPVAIGLGIGDTLVPATDGVSSHFAVSLDWQASPQEMAGAVLTRHSRATDDALVLVTRYVSPDRDKSQPDG
jgi:negative regulator of sigma-B (phosphoserine phosphatase)